MPRSSSYFTPDTDDFHDPFGDDDLNSPAPRRSSSRARRAPTSPPRAVGQTDDLPLPFDADARAKTSRGRGSSAKSKSSNSRSSGGKNARRASEPPRRNSRSSDVGSRVVELPHPGVWGFVLLVLGGWLAFCVWSSISDGLVPRAVVSGLRYAFGNGASLFALAIAWSGVLLLWKRRRAPLGLFWSAFGLGLLLFLGFRTLVAVAPGNEFNAETLRGAGGVVGAGVATALRKTLGEVGAALFLGTASLVALYLYAEHAFSEWIDRGRELVGDGARQARQQLSNAKKAAVQKLRERAESSDDEDEFDWNDEDDPELPSAPVRAMPRSRTQSRTRASSPFFEVGEANTEDANTEDAFTEAPSHEANVWSSVRPATDGGAGEIEPSALDDEIDLEEINVEAPFERLLREREQKRCLTPSEAPLGSENLVAEGAAPQFAGPTPRVDPDSSIDAPRFVGDLPNNLPGGEIRIEKVENAEPKSEINLEAVISGANADTELTPTEALEKQAEASARESDEPAPAAAPIVLQKPRKRFGNGPLMPEYFDSAFQALDEPLEPDLSGAEEEIQKSVKGIEETLGAFKIDARVTDVKRGPVITRYEVQPGAGVRVATIANLDKDLARSLSALAVRIEAPVPGKNVVGIEIPNKKVHLVRMRDVAENPDFLAHQSKLAFVLGRDIAGQPKWADLTKMPHLLIAGATNSGKSVCLNSIIASILVRARPDEVRLSLIDPKRVELTLYRGIKHLMHDVVVEPKHAVTALKRAIDEMDRRYKLFAQHGVRNIASFNQKLPGDCKPLPYIVIVIDELADLMMTAAAEFEKLICRLAQLARATGIHLIVATQRPSVNVITGVIKANIPARIAFAVASQVDSRTILDQVGAERLIGSGDMLFDANNGGKSVRIQGAYLSEEEVNRIVDAVKEAYLYEEDEAALGDLPEFDLYAAEEDEETQFDGMSSEDEKRDALYPDIVEFSQRLEEVSASMIQRKFGIGYPRAGRIVDHLEKDGYVGPADGPKARKVLRGGGE